MFQPGDILSGYQIESVLGRGGMGVVYRAHQASMQRSVALKVLSGEFLEDDAFRERFRREGRIAAQLDHPNILPVFEAGEADGQLFIVMRLVDGPTMGDLIAEQGALRWQRVLEILAPIASALDAADKAGLVHRDVKPHNILISSGGHPYLADFGLMRLARSSGVTRIGDWLGSPDYAAPEHMTDQAYTSAGDVYSLAAVAYHALTGHVAYDRMNDLAVLHAHASAPPPKITAFNRDAPPRLDDIIAWGMAKDAADRPAHASTLIAELAMVLRSATVDAVLVKDDAGHRERTPHQRPRHPTTNSIEHPPTPAPTMNVQAASNDAIEDLQRSGFDRTVVEQRPIRRDTAPDTPIPKPRQFRRIAMAAIASLSILGALAAMLTITDDDKAGTGPPGAPPPNPGDTLTIYSSLPSTEGSITRDMVKGIQLALAQARSTAGGFRIKYEPKDDSALGGSWTPQAVSRNAREAAQDARTAVYIGEFHSSATAVSIPILSRAQVPQISPTSDTVGHTSNGPGAREGEPAKYYHRGYRNYVSITPKGVIQGAALATLMKQDGCTRVAMLHDDEVYGAGLSRNIAISAKQQGVRILVDKAFDPKPRNSRSLASRAKALRTNCFVFSGAASSDSVQVFKDFAAALPRARLYGPDTLAQSSFGDPDRGGIPSSIAARLRITLAVREASGYGPKGQRFFEDFKKRFGGRPSPYSIYGYEAMRLALDAVKRSRTGSRRDIVKALFATRDRNSVLGTYSIDRYGDTTLGEYGVYEARNGGFEFIGTIAAAPRVR